MTKSKENETNTTGALPSVAAMGLAKIKPAAWNPRQIRNAKKATSAQIKPAAKKSAKKGSRK